MVSTLEEISHVEAVDSVRVLANDERLHLLRLLMRGPATLTQLGAVMGHHPAWVRHHLLSLEHAGLVELVETRQTKNFTEKFYCATARAYAVNFMVLPEVGEAGLLVLLGSDDAPLRSRGADALAVVPAISGAARAGRLVVEVAVTNGPWPGSNGTAKRTLSQARSPEVRV